MLRELHISNLAVIEDATVEFEPGLNVFTGQTGAGKSLVIGAFEALIGLRKATDMIRPGADEARISGVFEADTPALAAALTAALDQTIEPGDEMLITRKLFASGRSSLSVNGQPATAAMMRRAADLLVDIHGQYDHQFLLKPSNQLTILDAFAGCVAQREKFAVAFAERRELRMEKEELAASATLRRQQLELYEFQAEEIDTAELQLGEFPELQARETVLGNVQKIKGEASAAHSALYDAEGSVTERLQAITHLMIDLAELDPGLAEVTDQVRTCTLSLQEAAFELGRYVDRLEHNPEEAAEVAERLNTINRLVQKYGDGVPSPDPVESVLNFRDELGEQLDHLRSQNHDQSRIDERIAQLDKQLAQLGEKLTLARRKAAKKLTPQIEKQLADLGMAEAKLSVAFDRIDDSPTGFDAVEIIVQTNPGQEARPIRKIASGGELSRTMLAIKSVLATTGDGQRISVLVFDEIDANIGGRLGSVIGSKLRALAKPQAAGKSNRQIAKSPNHQILCITHLPQIAAFADRHFHIVKTVVGKGKAKQTHTTVGTLEGDARVNELAEMMAGEKVTATSKKQAKELLNQAM
ncbi:DNA repair protein RecN [Algisphaera agarilytica]|uniref:DNA repair protein RecN n=1 Tax=Algisphaera agarilytica TaxID=1385975 RepID=A0A7X0H827_9BACT|nr:DNA repair protein RecN [Algisphaera agarilytica]MBB6430976.1 DNA repair protein RecN (Recombination protein N) [Algisphaera agarilytica]